MQLTVLSYNTLFAGRDGLDMRRADAQRRIIDDARPDIFLMQEAKGFDATGSAALYELEAQTGLRGFLAPAPRTGQNVAIFIRPPLQPVSFESDTSHFHHALAVLTLKLPSSGPVLTVISAHLCPNGAAVRQREAGYLAVRASPENLALLAGDFNSASPHDLEPPDFAGLPAHHRTRYISDDLQTIDRTVLARLEAAGWIDVGHALDSESTPTVPTASFVDTEFATMRCDYMMASKALAQHAKRYEVIRTADSDMASDHYPIVATFELKS